MPIHVRANPGDFAPAVLVPGDPKRAKYIAETFFDPGFRCVNDERGELGALFTRTVMPALLRRGATRAQLAGPQDQASAADLAKPAARQRRRASTHGYRQTWKWHLPAPRRLPEAGYWTAPDNGKDGIYTVELTDITGKVVMHQSTTEHTLELSLSGLEAGIYLVKVTDSEGAVEINRLAIE